MAEQEERRVRFTAMISEHVFSVQFSTFWRSSLPNLEAVLRALNLGYERIAKPFKPETYAARRDIISETGFRLFGLRSGSPRAYRDLVEQAAAEAAGFLGHKRAVLDQDEAAEAIQLAERLFAYASENGGLTQFMPSFAGHGMMTACHGDLVVGDALVEVKYVARSFRSTDLRQLLCYCALRYLAEHSTFERVTLLNPLRGVAASVGLVELVTGSSGSSPEEFFQEMSYVLSSGEISR